MYLRQNVSQPESICSYLNDTLSHSDYAASNNSVMMKNEFERIWKEAVSA
jgi:hypothetical protein